MKHKNAIEDQTLLKKRTNQFCDWLLLVCQPSKNWTRLLAKQ